MDVLHGKPSGVKGRVQLGFVGLHESLISSDESQHTVKALKEEDVHKACVKSDAHLRFALPDACCLPRITVS